MKFPADSPVTPKKLAALRTRIATLRIDLALVAETAITTGGPGGQKVNKTASGVRLHYPFTPEDTVIVKWSRERSRALNRFLALRELVDQIERRVDPTASTRVSAAEKKRKQRARRKRRSPSKPGAHPGVESAPDAT